MSIREGGIRQSPGSSNGGGNGGMPASSISISQNTIAISNRTIGSNNDWVNIIGGVSISGDTPRFLSISSNILSIKRGVYLVYANFGIRTSNDTHPGFRIIDSITSAIYMNLIGSFADTTRSVDIHPHNPSNLLVVNTDVITTRIQVATGEWYNSSSDRTGFSLFNCKMDFVKIA